MIKQTKKQEDLRGILQQEIANAENVDQQAMQQQHEEALNYYFGNAPGRTQDADPRVPEDRAAIVSTDVGDMVNAVLAQLTPMLSTDALVEFEAKGKEDEEHARAESNAVNHVIIEQNAGFLELQEAIKDALLLRNCAAKIRVEDEVSTRSIPLTDDNGDPFPNEVIAALLIPRAPNERRELKKDKIIVTTTDRAFLFDAVPFENIIYTANATDTEIQNLSFFAERLYYTRSELIKMGYKRQIVDELQHVTGEQNITPRARDKSHQQTRYASSTPQQYIECYECYVMADLDDDGIAERYRVLLASNYVLDYEPAEVIPYAVGTAFLSSHRIAGESLFDRLKSVQDYKTEFMRNWVDNQQRMIFGTWIGDPHIHNFDDMAQGSNAVRTKDMNRIPVKVEHRDLGPSILAALEYQDKRRTEKGGAALDMMSADAQLVGETAYGIERQYAQRELMVTFMGRNLAETFIRPIYLLMHYFMRTYSNAPLELKMAGEWTSVDPTQWRARQRCSVKAGLSAGERTHMQRTLQQLLSFQLQAIQAGQNGVLADISTVYNTVMDWCNFAGLDNGDSYVINPKSQAAQQAAQQNVQAQQQQAQAQQQAQQQLIQLQMQLEMAKLQQAAKEADDELSYKYWSDRLQSETKEAEIVAKGITDLNKVQLEGQQREAQQARTNGAAERATNAGENT
ncbi:portal protein [Shimia aestuarii]|uniref:Portal protein n=1 Tax=Shimia aestuarii TaxID=254406 RepID=A0A1I4HSM8_9RHOB|nr:hypothetical protein [Shimia aestuarii]SFL44820.1 hypothetical protein SAMN04488042_101236 [Shimia aestuarii]